MILAGILCFCLAVVALAPIPYDADEFHGVGRSPLRIGAAGLSAIFFAIAIAEVMLR